MAYFITTACTKCNACLDECPTKSIIEGERTFIIDSDTCADHAACVAVCPVNAIVPMSERFGPKLAPGEQKKKPEPPKER